MAWASFVAARDTRAGSLFMVGVVCAIIIWLFPPKWRPWLAILLLLGLAYAGLGAAGLPGAF